MSDTVSDNPERQRFELDIGGEIVFADYRRQPDTLVIRYVEAPPALRGTGASDRLMHGIMAIAEAEQRKVVPLCGYASAWIRRHKRYLHLLA